MRYATRARNDKRERAIQRAASAAGWSLFLDRMAGMYRCIRNSAATDADVTVYCDTPADAWSEAAKISREESDETP